MLPFLVASITSFSKYTEGRSLILSLIFPFKNLIHPHPSISPGCSPEATVCPGREIHSLLAGMLPPIRLLNVSNLSHGGSTHILPTNPAPFQKPSGVKRKAQGVTIKNLNRPSLWAALKSSRDAIADMVTSKYRRGHPPTSRLGGLRRTGSACLRQIA